MSSLNEIRKTRIQKLEKIKQAGIDPYPARSERTHTIKEAVESFEKLSKSSAITLVGRIRLIRSHGGSTFLHLEDETGKIQLFAKRDEIGVEQYKFLFGVLDIGDFLQVKGSLFLTQKGEKTLLVKSYSVLGKTLLPLPEKWHGLKDVEERFRKRYLDLIMNADARELFRKKAQFSNELRNFLLQNNFLEVETPVLEDVPGGAEAEPFITHHNKLDKDFYLRISLELHLKRLIVGGYENVFEIGRVFRNEGMDTEHLQEFTMLEFYTAYRDYNWLMEFLEKMYTHTIQKVFDTLRVGGLDFALPWPRVDYLDIFKQKTGIDLNKHPDKDSLITEVKKLDIKGVDFKTGRGRIIDQVYKRLVRPNIKGPAFLINHPVDVSPLAKRKSDDSQRTERLQILINGSELGNGYSELNDPLDQRARFEEQMKLRAAGDKEAQMIDEDFLAALEYGMPPTAGFGVGIDRLFMVVAGLDSIRETVFFPMVK